MGSNGEQLQNEAGAARSDLQWLGPVSNRPSRKDCCPKTAGISPVGLPRMCTASDSRSDPHPENAPHPGGSVGLPCPFVQAPVHGAGLCNAGQSGSCISST